MLRLSLFRLEDTMKRRAFFLTMLMTCLLCGCGQSSASAEAATQQEKPEYELSVESTIGQEDCSICSNGGGSLMSYYGKKDSIGIIHLNDLSISDTEVRAFDDDGNEVFGQSSTNTMLNSYGEGCGSVMISGMPNRGYSDAKIYYKAKDEVNFDKLKDSLCQTCLDKVVEFYVDQKNSGDDSRLGTTGYCLVDFSTRELYTLSDPYRGYMIRDYYVRYDMEEGPTSEDDYIDLFTVYAPERAEQ